MHLTVLFCKFFLVASGPMLCWIIYGVCQDWRKGENISVAVFDNYFRFLCLVLIAEGWAMAATVLRNFSVDSIIFLKLPVASLIAAGMVILLRTLTIIRHRQKRITKVIVFSYAAIMVCSTAM